jgi:hypothetical protein
MSITTTKKRINAVLINKEENFRTKLTFESRIVGICSESVFQRIGRAEDVKASELKGNDEDDLDSGEIKRKVNEVASLEAINHRDPAEITECQHKSETV